MYHALDAVLPPDIPIVWGHDGFQMSVVQQLRALDGVFRPGRPALAVPPEAPTLLRAKRLFFVRPTNRTFRDMPPQTTTTQRLLNAALGRAVRLHFNRSLGPGDSLAAPSVARGARGQPPPELALDAAAVERWREDEADFIPDETLLRVLLLSRAPPDPAMRGKQPWWKDQGRRHVLNDNEIMAAARNAIPALVSVERMVPGADQLAVADKVSRACLIIVSHWRETGDMRRACPC